MSNTFETNSAGNSTEKVESPSAPEVMTESVANFETVYSKTELEIRALADAAIQTGIEGLLRLSEMKGSPDAEMLEKINTRIATLQKNASQSMQWVKERFNLSKMETEDCLGMELQGSSEFRRKIKDAVGILSLLPDTFLFCAQRVHRIQEWDRSGMNMQKDMPTFQLGPTWETWNATELASGIAHEAVHCLQYEEGTHKGDGGEWRVTSEAFYSADAEREALHFQIKMLEDLKTHEYFQGDDKEKNLVEIQKFIDEIKELAINPTYQDIPYHERNW